MKKADNRGLSLIELLVAICILAIVAVPMLHSFVSSYRVNARSRQTMRATTLAQNEMEIFEKEKIEDLMDPAKFSYVVTKPTPGDPIPGCYTFSRQGIINDDSGRSMFDVYVTLNPERTATGDIYYDVNSQPVLDMNTISVLDSGRFVQTVRTERNKNPLDTEVYKEYVNYSTTLGTNKDVAYFEQNLDRTITVDIFTESDPAGGTPVTKAKVTYVYNCPIADIVPAGNQTVTKETVIFDNSQSLNEDGEKVALKSVYLFYAPRYTANNDVIVINNTEGLAVDAYIIRQDILNTAGSAVEPIPMSYKASLKITDPVVDGKSGGSYHTNLNINIPPEDTPTSGQQFSLLFNGAVCDAGTPRTDALNQMGFTNLGGSHVKDRIYSMKVDVYQKGAVPGTDKPLVTLTGTKLE